MTSSTTQPTTTSGSTERKPWTGFGYVQVRGLADRVVARYLRTQRKNMRRFFAEHGFSEFALRMDEIRRSRQGMIAKNRMFQGVLNEYSERVRPAPQSPEAAHSEGSGSVDMLGGSAAVGIRGEDAVAVPRTDALADTGRSIPEVASADGVESVIEE